MDHFISKPLEGNHVQLIPLSPAHAKGIIEATYDGHLYNLDVTAVPGADTIEAFIETALNQYKTGQGLAFATLCKPTRKIIGSTRFFRTDFIHKCTEIGHTFIAKSMQRTAANTEAKYLMLSYAFEELFMNRVEFMTDELNEKSRTAILRIGAKYEGILRQNRIMPSGRVRDTAVYSIIRSQWPEVKAGLLSRLKNRSK